MLVFLVCRCDVRVFLPINLQIVAHCGIFSSITGLQVITKVHTFLWRGLLLSVVLFSFRIFDLDSEILCEQCFITQFIHQQMHIY